MSLIMNILFDLVLNFALQRMLVLGNRAVPAIW